MKRVTLIGAGPGDAGLLTLKGAERLRQADVVLYDRFVCDEILKMIPEDAEAINVGKQAGNHPVPQWRINEMLLENAEAGLEVVRLKGGDPFVFGRGGEELELLAARHISFEVIPGISSAIAGPAYAGIPVTHRDCASSLHFYTSHSKDDEMPDIDFKALAASGGTAVFLMGVAAIEAICAGCQEAGMDARTPAAVVENATTARQRKFVGSLADLPAIARRNQVVSPALVIVGEVCRYSESFDWFSARPLFGRRIAVPRVKPGPSRLAGRLGELGAEVTEFQVAELRPLGGEGSPLDEAIGNIGSYSWLVFTSEFGVQVFFEEMERGDRDIRLLAALRIACVGSSTAQALRQYGIKADYVPDDYNGTALARGLTQLVKPGQRVLLARAESAADDLPEILKLAGIIVSDLPIYSREPVDLARAAVDFDFTAFTSSSAVEGFAEALGEHALAGLRAVCIGSRTAATALSLGMNVYLSEQSTIEGLVAKIKELSANGNQDKATA